MDLVDGPSVVEANRSFRQRRGRLQKLQAWLSSVFSDDAAYARAHALEGERGHYVVIAHAAQPEVVERVSPWFALMGHTTCAPTNRGQSPTCDIRCALYRSGESV